MKFGLSEKHLKILEQFFQSQESVQRVKVYGSRALGNYRKGSDIDLSIEGNETELNTAHLLSELEELSTPYFFDLTNYKEITNLNLKEHIDQHGIVLWTQKNRHETGF